MNQQKQTNKQTNTVENTSLLSDYTFKSWCFYQDGMLDGETAKQETTVCFMFQRKKKKKANYSDCREIFQPLLWQQNWVFLARRGNIFQSSVIFWAKTLYFPSSNRLLPKPDQTRLKYESSYIKNCHILNKDRKVQCQIYPGICLQRIWLSGL